MKLTDLLKNNEFKLLTNIDIKDVEINSVNTCDLLSFVMANGKKNQAWITILTHQNILAVASLLEMACIIISDGLSVNEDIIKKAEEEGVVIISTKYSNYEIYNEFNGKL